jgi:protein Mpv17
LDKHIGSKGYSVAIKKVACDQLFFAPTFIAVLLVTIGICQGKNIEKLKMKLKNEYGDILKNNYKVTNLYAYFLNLKLFSLLVC